MPKTVIKASDLGLAIRDFLEGRSFFAFGPDMEQTETDAQIDCVDVSDAAAPTVQLDNGSQFQIRISELFSAIHRSA